MAESWEQRGQEEHLWGTPASNLSTHTHTPLPHLGTASLYIQGHKTFT